ncbi:MAG: hypothetical protein ACYDC3_08560 [Candidatus Binataceae bacterium]
MVGTPLAEEGGTLLVLFCEACGQNVARRANGDSRVNYKWDRLAAFESHGLTARWKWRRARRPGKPVQESAADIDEASDATIDAGAETRAALLKDSRTQAYLLARDLLLEGGCRQREMRIRALRVGASMPVLDQALEQLGATYGRDGEGQVLVFPPVAMQSFERPSQLGSIARDPEAGAPRFAASQR